MARTTADLDDGDTLDGADVTDVAPEPDDEDFRSRQRRLRVADDLSRPRVRLHRVPQVRRGQHR